MGIVMTEAGITPKRDASQIPAAARADITAAPGILWATPPWVNRYKAGDLSDSIIKKISVSRMTAPIIAKGRRDEGLPAARKSVTVTRAWESASTSQVCEAYLQKGADRYSW
jgi:hypothetical protein